MLWKPNALIIKKESIRINNKEDRHQFYDSEEKNHQTVQLSSVI